MKWTVDEAKTAFNAEIEKIHDEKLKNACMEMVKKIPDYFWTAPASSSGKYHPECDLDDGGLVRHSIMVATCADDLVTCEMFVRESDVNRDIARVAALFHDSWKNGKADENGAYGDHTVHEHPKIASEFVREELTAAEIDDLKVEMISGAIYTHMGKWCVSKYSDVALSKPRTDFEKLLHLADYVASRKYIAGLESWKKSE